MEIRQEPDYRLPVTIAAGSLRVENVLCNLYLPGRLTDPVRLHFRLTREQANLARGIFQFSIEGTSRDAVSGQPRVVIQADSVFPERLSTKFWGFEIDETIFVAEPTDLRVRQLLDDLGASVASQRTVGTFWLTPSLLLSPDKWIEYSTTGEVRVKTVRQLLFTLPSGLPLTFDTEFRHEKRPGETVTYTELVAAFEDQSEVLLDPDSILGELDDILMLTSFAERRRCVCLGRDIWKPGSRTRYFRRDIAVPKGKNGHDLNDVLIDIAQFEAFLSRAYKTLVDSPHKELLRQALHRSIPREGRTVESGYLTLYSALETLVLVFRKEHQLERVLAGDEWAQVRQDLLRWIRRQPHFTTKEKRRHVYEKINELNRVSFGAAFSKFCESYSVDLTGLWPVTAGAGGASLSAVRNKIVHGDYFDRSQFAAVSVARDHLQWVVERALLAVLGWPVEQSKVSRGFLQNFTSYEGWESHRATLFLPISAAPENEDADS